MAEAGRLQMRAFSNVHFLEKVFESQALYDIIDRKDRTAVLPEIFGQDLREPDRETVREQLLSAERRFFMEKEKYVAYVSTYTRGDKNGIKIYDVDMEKGRFIEKDKVEITNSSYVTISHNGKILYSITDFGVEAYVILEDGSLEFLKDRKSVV